MDLIYVALAALAVAAGSGAVLAGVRAASPEDGVARQVTLGILAVLLLAVAAGAAFLIWFLYRFTMNFTF